MHPELLTSIQKTKSVVANISEKPVANNQEAGVLDAMEPLVDTDEDVESPEENEEQHLSDIESVASNSETDTMDFDIPEPTIFPGAGSILRGSQRFQNLEEHLWSPFSSKLDFQLARWFIESRTPKEHVQRFFKGGLQPLGTHLNSAYSVFETVDRMEWGLGIGSWKEGRVNFNCDAQSPFSNDTEIRDNEELQTKFFFRDPVECVRYLLGQPCFSQDTVYTPVLEFNAEVSPQRVYSEMDTAEWWWEVQESLMLRGYCYHI